MRFFSGKVKSGVCVRNIRKAHHIVYVVEIVETQSSCCDETLKLDAKRVINNDDDDGDKTVAIIWVLINFLKLKRKSYSGKI